MSCATFRVSVTAQDAQGVHTHGITPSSGYLKTVRDVVRTVFASAVRLTGPYMQADLLKCSL